jgi:CIC family chloride channel protein
MSETKQAEEQTGAVDSEQVASLREERLLLLLSIFVGVIAGLLVVSFHMAFDWMSLLLLGSSPQPHQLRLIVVPTIAGLVIAVLVRYVFPAARGSGVNQTKAALYIHNGYISSRTVIGKFLLSALALGAGFSSGPEDPSLQIGAGVASQISRRFGLSRAKMRLFAPIGAAAGLAAAFNAPISAILFVIEEVIGNWNAALLGSIVLAAISSVVVARWFWGAEPMFRIPAVNLVDPRELLAYAVLGVVGGVASLFFTRAVGWLRPALRRQPASWQLVQPAAAGFLVGCIGYFGLPQVMGAGYEAIDAAMHAQFAWKVLLLLALFKIIATTLSFSSGTPGGMFAPTLFVGAMLGAAVGSFEHHFLPHVTGSIGSYALVGMGVLFAAFLRAPLTSIFMAMEVSQNYSIVLPVILANTIAYLIARALQPVPIFEVFTHQDGLDLPSMEEQREESDLHLEDALHPVSVPVLQGSETIANAAAALQQYGDLKDMTTMLVHCSDRLWYAATRAEMEGILAETLPAAAAGDVAGAAASVPEVASITAEPKVAEAAGTVVVAAPDPDMTLEQRLGAERTPILFPDLPLAAALPHFRRWPVLPITNRAVRGALEGTVSLEDVLRRYQER